MKTIKEDVTSELIINKSKFITILTNVNNVEEANEKLNYYKNVYKNATHYCTAYIIDSHIKCSDDKEPSGTAGIPILNVLKNNNLQHILCIVIRYFGGIKLGTGGLTRAYSNSVSKAILEATITNLTEGYYLEISFNYNDTKTIDNILKNYEIKKTYNQDITYSFKISKEEFNKIEPIIIKNTKIIKKEPITFTL